MADFFVRLEDIQKSFIKFCDNVTFLYQLPPQTKDEMWEFFKQLVLSQSIGEDYMPPPQDVIDIAVPKKDTAVSDIAKE